MLLARRAGDRGGREDGAHRRARPSVATLRREPLADLWHPGPSFHPQPRPVIAHRRPLWRARGGGGPGRHARADRRHQHRPEHRQPRLDDHLGSGRVDRVHRALLRPTSPQRGVRPPARRGGAAAVLTRALVLGLALWMALPSSAAADTLTLTAYRARLVQARALVDRSRVVGTADQERML